MYKTEALFNYGLIWKKKHDLWDLLLLKRRILFFPPLKTKTWPVTDESPVSRSALARGDKQPNAVLHPHKELWLTLPLSLLLLYLPGSRGKTESEFAHVNASPNHAGGSSVPARASVPFQSSARDFMWDSWTQRIWAPQWRHSQLQHGASRDTPNNVWPQWPPAYSGPQAFGCQRRTGVRMMGVVWWGISSVHSPPSETSFIKP